MKSLIVIPTYNESQNIEHIVRTIFAEGIKGFETHILVVDDNSPDGTSDIVKRMKETGHPDTLFLLSRDRKSGLGTAYIAGFQWGITQGYQVFVEMDADLSHNPRYLSSMMEKTGTYDFVVGSRYVPGGGVKGWGFLRKNISRFGSLYARMILGMPMRDLTGGFNIWKRDVLEAIDLNKVRSEGYAFQIELKYRAFSKGFSFIEFPIIFEDRRLGRSKMSKKILLEAMYRVWQLKMLRDL